MKTGPLILGFGLVALVGAGLYFFVFRPKALAGEGTFGGPPVIADSSSFEASIPGGADLKSQALELARQKGLSWGDPSSVSLLQITDAIAQDDALGPGTSRGKATNSAARPAFLKNRQKN